MPAAARRPSGRFAPQFAVLTPWLEACLPVVSRFVRYAPKAARFLVTTLTENLPYARRLVVSAPLVAADGGEGGDYTLSVNPASSTARGALRLAGHLGGTADSPEVRGLRVVDGGVPQLLALGEIQDGEGLVRVGSSIEGRALAPLDGSGRVGATHAPAKSVYATGGAQALGPGDIGAVPPGRTVAAGQGLSGGGDLAANRTLSIAAFTGLVSRDLDPPSSSWAANESKVHATYDIGEAGMLVPASVRLPATVNSALVTEAVFEFHDASTRVLANAATGQPLDESMQGLANLLMGGPATAEANNGRSVRKLVLRTRNTTGNAVNNVDIGLFRVRAYAFPRGAGGPL